jgi:5'-3' exonuclease/uncharacterized protein YozE (UPF0346 family)
MGIKFLNNFLVENCSADAISKKSLRHLANRTVVIDTSIYLYKFAEKNAVAENIYLMIAVFREYNITPVFIFDGKPPAEKKELLMKRKREKDAAETRYNELKHALDASMNGDAATTNADGGANGQSPVSSATSQKMVQEMNALRKKFVRVSEQHIRQSKEIMTAYGVPFIESLGESDHLCAFLVKHGFAWACVSDDMDMFLYGCPRVLRHLSLLNHDGIFYDTATILRDLEMTQEIFNDIVIMSGTDYNQHDAQPLSAVIHLYMEYREWAHYNRSRASFYHWLVHTRKFMETDAPLVNARQMFDLDLYLEQHRAEFKQVVDKLPFHMPRDVDRQALEDVMRADGFVFVA